jgi:hypothetical protein
MSSPFPLYFPPEAHRLFESASLVRRVAQLARWDSRAQLAELYGTATGLALAKALDCELTVVEPPGRQLDWLKERARAAAVDGRVRFEASDPLVVALPKAKFHGIFCLGRVTGEVGAEAKRLRPFLGERGRAGLTAVVKVGRQPNERALGAWQARLGAPLPLPREALLAMEAEGYEPELVETAGEAELDGYYEALEAALAKSDASKDDAATKAARDELSLYRQLGGRTGVTFAFLLGRRKEPGEKPPMSRDNG